MAQPKGSSRPPNVSSSRPPNLGREEVTITESRPIPNVGVDDEEMSITDQTSVVAPKSVRTKQHPTLLVMSGDSAGKVFRIEIDRVIIGRSRQCDITLMDHGISRQHCAIVRDGAECLVEDMGSTNGTIVNGRRVERLALVAGDRVQIGPEVVFQFGYFDDAEEALAVRLYEAATRDPLTRAHNRRSFLERLSAETSYAARHKEKLALVILDVDHFKSVNDSYGHAVGDDVLREVAKVIGSTLRNEDLFARYGGEEFVILARGLSVKNAAKLAERVRKAFEEKVMAIGKQKFRVTISLGVAELSECKTDVTGTALLQLADGRLYAAKEAGRNRVVAK
jgi:diguanylate cyclase (GGDEF)-like protein